MQTIRRTESVNDVYTIGEELGRGSFSIVYRATHKTTGKDWAVKIVDKDKLGPKKMEMVDTEIEILSKLTNSHIIRLSEVYDDEKNCYMIMELVTGGELFDKIVELQSYSEKDASKLIEQLIEAVEDLHKNKIVHRDLKPENLLLSSNDADADIKLADFGLSTFVEEHTKLKKAVGTPGYIAPEILQTLDEILDGYGKEVDMWSVGVILYILLCGFPPFYAEDDDESFDQIISGVFEYPEPYWNNVSHEAKDLINHLLVVDAKKRYSATQALQHPWIKDNNHVKPLEGAQAELKKFNAKKKWKKAGNAVRALGRMGHLKSLLAKQAIK
ncbi:hypothetical protein PROFUN_00121 [Planoprotostelium fungivorum]|uniref:Protein kinase domain-containing protein n=1 Tax=Planoprotostelium fungivorum TaxID=1890364 RepID=A0A2P6P0S1_9EUKA|nr:hypothetical protein PROFUN_00121 [Planoprotostelium fungivorum]